MLAQDIAVDCVRMLEGETEEGALQTPVGIYDSQVLG